MTLFNFFMQVVGYQIQTIPFALLVLLALPKECLRVSFLRLTNMILLTSIFLSIGFGIMTIYILHDYAYALVRQYANLYFFLSVIIGCFILFFYIHTVWIRKLMVLSIVMQYGAFIFTFTATLTEIIYWLPDSTTLVYYVKNNIINIFLIFITYPFITMFMRKFVRTSLSQMGMKAMKRGCLYMVLALLLYCMAVFLLTNNTYGIVNDDCKLSYMIILALTDVILYYMFYVETDLSIENYKLQLRLKMAADQYQNMAYDIAEVKQIRHDLYSYVQKIASLYNQNKDEELKNYLKQVAQSIYHHDQQVITGHAYIDAVLRFYRDAAQSFHIHMNFIVDNFTTFHTKYINDLVALISDTLKQAIQCIKEDDHSVIDVELYLHEGTCLYIICVPTKKYIFHDPFEYIHLVKICNKYKGNMVIYQKKGKQIIQCHMNIL